MALLEILDARGEILRTYRACRHYGRSAIVVVRPDDPGRHRHELHSVGFADGPGARPSPA